MLTAKQLEVINARKAWEERLIIVVTANPITGNIINRARFADYSKAIEFIRIAEKHNPFHHTFII